MDVTIRNVDEEAWRRLKAHAAYHDMSIGEALNQVVTRELQAPHRKPKPISFFDIPPVQVPPGAETNLSARVDEILMEEFNRRTYGDRRGPPDAGA